MTHTLPSFLLESAATLLVMGPLTVWLNRWQDKRLLRRWEKEFGEPMPEESVPEVLLAGALLRCLQKNGCLRQVNVEDGNEDQKQRRRPRPNITVTRGNLTMATGQDGWQKREIQRALLAEIDNVGQPWTHNAGLRNRLDAAGFRYATLIGITEVAEGYEQEAAGDREKYKQFIKTHEGMPLWTDEDAVSVVCDLTGVGRELAKAWLDYDWP